MPQATRGPQGTKPFLLSPEQTAHLGMAYEAALTIAQDAGSPFADVPHHELRERLARLIILAAREGVTDIDQLKARALRTLPVLVAQGILGQRRRAIVAQSSNAPRSQGEISA